MKTNLILSGLLMAVLTAHATVYDSGTVSVGTAIPDNNPSGYASSVTFATGDVNAINGVSVTLNLSGGYNGDLYGYLINPNGDLAVLLNRVGQTGGNYGYGDAGMNVTLSDFGTFNSIQDYQNHSPVFSGGQLTGTWAPAGDFSALHTGSLDGQWTLFLADLSSGDQSTLVNWNLNISVVPEPVTWALLLFGAVMALAGLGILIRRWSNLRMLPEKITAWMDAV